MRELINRLDGWQEEQVDFRARLVNQDSGTDDRDDVNQDRDMLAAPLAELGFAVTRVTPQRCGDHLVPGRHGCGIGS